VAVQTPCGGAKAVRVSLPASLLHNFTTPHHATQPPPCSHTSIFWSEIRSVWNVLSARHLPWKWVAIPPAAPNSCVVQLPAVVPAVSLEKTDDEAIPPTQKKTDQRPPVDEFIIEQPKTPAATDTNDEDFFTPESKPTTPVSSSDDEDHRSSDAMQMRGTASDTAVGASIEESTFDYLNEIEISFSDDDIPSG
jgi:hypothetical protein